MIGLDTNVLVRLLTRDDVKRAERVRSLFDEHADEDEAFFVADVVVAELAWTLERTYQLERSAIGMTMHALADNVTLSFESREVLREALAAFGTGAAGFSECLIVAKAAAVGCKSLVTFDKRMRGLPAVEVL
jgi:predicted nucleic-acid-binding protein